MKRMSILTTAAALAVGMFVGGSAPAAPVGHVFAVPGSASVGYANRIVVITKGSTTGLHNLDIAQHDVVSTDGLFRSALVGVGKTTPVLGTSALAKGNYRFFCSIHPNMKGTLQVK